LGLAGRLKAVALSYILFDNRPNIGDSWNHRYDSLRWHTIKQYGNLPFGRTFAEDDDNLLPAKRIGAGYEAWSKRYDINTQSETNVDSATWNEASQTWSVRTSGVQGKEEWISKNLVLCIGPVCQWMSPSPLED
jgi:cation diffusion facilitator CzcD-associated flavoprotein CzcO